MNLLALDIGNTSANIGIFCEDRLIGHSQVKIEQFLRRPQHAVSSLLKTQGITPKELSGVAVASVVPDATEACERICRNHLHIQPLIIRGTTPTKLRVNYRPARSLGPDRLAIAIAACHFKPPPVICASLGTATVVDAVSKDSEFLGGAIFPGLQLLTEALAEHTALLPLTAPAKVDDPLGKTTNSALRAGAIYGTAYALEGFVRNFRKQIGKQAKFILTGGNAPLVAPYLKNQFFHQPNLALWGIWLIWKDQRLSKKHARKRASK